MHADNESLVSELMETLMSLPGVRFPSVDETVDTNIDITIGSDPVRLLVECKKNVFPRDVQQILWARHSERGKENRVHAESIFLLAADSISPGARKLLEDEQVGYFAAGGSLYLSTPKAYFYIERPVAQSEKKATRNFYSGRRAQVIHHLLNHPDEWFGVKQLATLAHVSAATASGVLTTLERFEWLQTRGQGPSKERMLCSPRELLDAWAKQVAELPPYHVRRYYVPGFKGDQLVERLAQVFIDNGAQYAITHEAAAQRYTPFLTSISQVRCVLHRGWTADLSLSALDARAVSEGANLVIIDSNNEDDFLETTDVDSITLMSPVRVYLDLLRGEGRARELAEHLRKERIGF